MASAAAALLDELMGRNRNAAADEKNMLKWDSDQVCKYFLAGYCPNDLFTNTKADLGVCTKLHDDIFLKEYRESSRFEKMGYEEAFVEFLESMISDVDKRIKRGHARLAASGESEGNTPGASGPKQDKARQLTVKIDDLVEQAEKLGCEGKVEEAQGVMKLCDQLRRERQQLEQSENRDSSSVIKQMEVCPVCGAFLIVGDAESRQKEHLLGKQHMGYAQLRTTVEDFKEKKRQQAAAERAEREKAMEERRKRLRSPDRRRRSRSRDRGRLADSRDQYRGNNRNRRRGDSRERRRGGSRERRRSRDRRSRSRDRHRRSSSRSRHRRSRDYRRSRSTDRRGSRDRRSRDYRSRSRDRRRSRSRDHRNSRKPDSRRESSERPRRDSAENDRSRSSTEKESKTNGHEDTENSSQTSPANKSQTSSANMDTSWRGDNQEDSRMEDTDSKADEMQE